MINSVRKIYKECKSALYHGNAFKRMELGRYKSAALILESVCQDNPDSPNIEYSYYSIGQCYFRLGELKTALIWLSKSNDLYRKNISGNRDFRYLSGYRDMLKLYCKALRIDRQNELAYKILRENEFGS
jgi:tetratricopeptide (TPR) repeat protein